jgi:hypothetical protein
MLYIDCVIWRKRTNGRGSWLNAENPARLSGTLTWEETLAEQSATRKLPFSEPAIWLAAMEGCQKAALMLDNGQLSKPLNNPGAI